MVMITSDACLGIIEVKSRIAGVDALHEAVTRLSESSLLIQQPRAAQPRATSPFVGLFAYEWRAQRYEQVLDILQDATAGPWRRHNSRKRVVNHVALGPSHFFRFWESEPVRRGPDLQYDHWHAYRLEHRAFGYFINNAVEAVSLSATVNAELWFPRDGKESGLQARRPLGA